MNFYANLFLSFFRVEIQLIFIFFIPVMKYPKWPQFLAARMTAFSPLAISPRLMATTPAATTEINSKKLRKMFLEFFISDSHRILPSAVLHFDPYRVKVIFKLKT
jgi:hypothetical protein